MKIYSYNEVSHEFTSEGVADRDPLIPGNWLIPANTTTIAPPSASNHQAAVFKDGQWQLVDDYRGTEYWLADRTLHTITKLGETKPKDSFDQEPPLPSTTRRANALTAIDTAAGEVRSRYVSSGDYIDAEYTLAAQQAAEWTANGQADNAVPAAVQAWADAEGISAKDAADDITTKANAWQTILLKVRTLRLAGKAAIDNADDDANFEQIAQDYTAYLEAL